MISFSNINKQYGKQLLFVDASFQLNPGEKVGLVGPNGSGKTTLFRMVAGGPFKPSFGLSGGSSELDKQTGHPPFVWAAPRESLKISTTHCDI